MRNQCVLENKEHESHAGDFTCILHFSEGFGFTLQVQQPSSSERNHCDDGLYARVDQTTGKSKSNESKYENLSATS